MDLLCFCSVLCLLCLCARLFICALWSPAGKGIQFHVLLNPSVGVCNWSMFCCTLLYVHSSIMIILMGKRELVDLLNLSSWCIVMVEQLFLAVPRGCLRFVIVVFPDHTHLLFLQYHRAELHRICIIGKSTLSIGCSPLPTNQSLWMRSYVLLSKCGLLNSFIGLNKT